MSEGLSRWLERAKVAVMLTFDFDAETMWLARDPSNADRLGVVGQGTYGARVGVPRILELLREEEVKATFFVPGWTAEHHTAQAEAILRDGHEIGHHGYLHRWSDPEEPARDIEELDRGVEALKRVLGIRPRGYRAPAGEVTPHLLRCVAERGFLYDSSLMDDIDPFRIALKGTVTNLIELPWHWAISDATHALTSLRNPRPIFPNSHLFELFSDEFRELYRWGGMFNLVMHPQVTGRPARIALLRDIIRYLKGFPDVWFATGTEVAQAWTAGSTDR
jgi:peptidoglycan-N-acetylglucosamine deacetylase